MITTAGVVNALPGTDLDGTVRTEFMSSTPLEELRWAQSLADAGGQPTGMIVCIDFRAPDFPSWLLWKARRLAPARARARPTIGSGSASVVARRPPARGQPTSISGKLLPNWLLTRRLV